MTRAPVTLLLLVLSLCACGRSTPEGADRLGPRFAEVARLPDAKGSSERLAAAAREVRDDDPAAVDGLLAAHARGERLPGEACFDGVIEWRMLAELALKDPTPPGLDAAAWLGRRMLDDRPTLIGAVVGLSIVRDVLERLKTDRLPITPAVRAALPPDDLVVRTFAREALCAEAQVARGLPSKGDDLGASVIDTEKRMLVAFFERVMDAVAAAASPADAIGALERAGEEAAKSDSEVVRLVFTASGYEELEKERKAIAALVAALPEGEAPPQPAPPSPSGTAPSALEPEEPIAPAPADDEPNPPVVIPRARVANAAALRRELEGSGLTLTYDPEGRGFVVGGVTPGSIGALLGLKDGDRLESIGTDFAYEAHASGQSGHAFIVDGLGGDMVGATVRHGDRLRRITWRVE
ncbi:MAG: hypothetical protein IT385_25500 [Deltaproteobacteria bacterium]|nr:hypothetical protein [Deltaproteobacteria bacterium]